MRHYRDFKKPSRFFTSLLFLIAFFCFGVFSVHAQTAAELNTKINQKSDDIKKLEDEIKTYQAQLTTLSKEKSTLSGSIKELDITKKKLMADISVTQKKIDRTNLTIQSLSKDIHTKEGSIDTNQDAIALGIRQTDELERASLVETMLSTDDFTAVWNDVSASLDIRERMIEKIAELRKTKGELEDTRDETTKAKDELVVLRKELSDQQKIIDQNTAEKKKLLAQTQNNEANYQKLLTDRVAKKNAFEKELRDYESQLKYVLDPKSLPGGGVLSWPLDFVYITQLFGKTGSSGRLYASGSHNGVDFRAPVGTPVKAMADGVVAGIGDTDKQCPGVSFGRFALIKYDNGLAGTFGHFSVISVVEGQRVSRGQIVGYSGNTGYSTGPHLHVSIYPKDGVDLKTLPSISCPGHVLTQPISALNAYLDPMIYLPTYTAPKL